MKDLTVKENTYKIELSGNNLIDLSHTAEADMPCDPALALPELDFFSREGSGLQLHNLEVIRYCPHTGTHMDCIKSPWFKSKTVVPHNLPKSIDYKFAWNETGLLEVDGEEPALEEPKE